MYVPPSRRQDPNATDYSQFHQQPQQYASVPMMHQQQPRVQVHTQYQPNVQSPVPISVAHQQPQQHEQAPQPFNVYQHSASHHGGFQQIGAHQQPYPRAQHGDRRMGAHPGGYLRGHADMAPHHHAAHHHHNAQPHVHVAYTRDERPEDEIFKEHSPGINFDQYESIQVSVTPNDVTPAESFADMSLHQQLMENVSRCRYTKPTPVQRYGIPVVIAGRDMMACAQTGSGKTAAYLIPAVNFMLTHGTATGTMRTAAPSALIIAPTRELSIQIYEEGRKFTYRTGLRCVVVYGGADPRHQISELTRGCNLLVATPGRLWDMFTRQYVRFSDIRFMVLDEADRMLDMGFEPAIRQLVQGPETDMPRTGQRQTLMYSATFPREIQQLAREFLCQHSFLQVGRVGSTTENITQDVRFVEDHTKRDELLTILREYDGNLILVFVEKKRDADYLERSLRQMRISCASIHGDRVQREREEALAYFKNGVCRVLVATDVASRGLDIPNVTVVVQYDLPSNIDDYVHRIGRTGRAGKKGVAISFFNEKNRNIVDDLVPLLRETNQTVLPEIASLVTRRPPPQASRSRGGYRGGYGGNRGGYGGYHRGGGNNGGYGGNHHHGGGGFGNPTPNGNVGFGVGHASGGHTQPFNPTHNRGIFQPRH
mmetsp:Transcript_58281/g.67240  ORF Transcript_58281/g.67240 Transcript_58281/m.67240 type:complete len:653 (-) Transcript_58281:1642-3600(-)